MPEENEFNVNREWDFDVNLSGLAAPTGTSAIEVPEGFYKVVVNDMYINPDRNPDRVVIKMTITEGPYKGVVRTDGITLPKSETDKVRYYWRGMAESVGYAPGDLDGGSVKLGLSSFKEREGHIHFVPKDEAKGRQWERIHWLPPTEWNQQRQLFEAGETRETPKGDEGSALGAGPTGGDTTSKDAVLKKLGL